MIHGFVSLDQTKEHNNPVYGNAEQARSLSVFFQLFEFPAGLPHDPAPFLRIIVLGLES